MSIAAAVAALLMQAPQCPNAATAAALGAGLAPAELAQAIRAAEAHPVGSRQNPIRVCGPTGQRAYMARLRCGDGSRPRIGNRMNVGASPYRTINDLYPLDCGAAAPGHFELVMDMYHNGADNRVPDGFRLDPER